VSAARILVTGGAGYIGSHVTLALLEAGLEPIVLDNLSTGSRNAVPKEVQLIVGDLKDEARLATLLSEMKFDAIMHFAASTVAPASVADPFTYYTNNTSNTTRLGTLAVRAGVRAIVFSSTAAVYQSNGAQAVTEEAPKIPQSPYGWSKLLSERILRDMATASDMTLGVFRYFNVAGADPAGRAGQATPNATHLIKVACEHVVGLRDAITVYGTDFPTPDGTGVRDYIHVTDLADAHVAGLHHLLAGKPGFTLNCGYGRGASVLEVIEALRRVTGEPLKVKVADRRPGDPAAIFADPSKLREVLKWVPRYDDLDEIVRSALAWERQIQLKNTVSAG
jgi:UDP-glucose 4-epimerase